MRYRYYRIEYADIPRWVLGDIVDSSGRMVDYEAFLIPEWSVATPPALITIYAEGEAVDLSFVDSALVVRNSVGDILSRHCGSEIVRYPVQIEGHGDKWEIVKTTSLIDCIDPKRSLWMTPIADWTPPMAGDPLYRDPSDPFYTPYPELLEVAIDGAKIGESKLFRPRYSEGALIARDDVIQALREAKVTGLEVRCVSE